MAFRILQLCLCLAFAVGEWVEISQKPLQETSSNNSNVKVLLNNQVSNAVNVFEQSSPSPYWLDYQRQRFGQQHLLKQAHKFVVSNVKQLKNSAKVVVSPTTAPSALVIEPTPRYQTINSKLGINVVDVNKEPPNTQHAQVEITSRQYVATQSSEHLAEEPEVETNINEEEYNEIELFPTMKGFIDFVKNLKKDWMKKAALSINQKIKMLEMLRDNLMHAVEERFMALWEPEEQRRKKRGLLDESNLNFPPEAALMSINFLTFAVFLIKLVLNVAHIIKSKHYNFTGFGINNEVVRNRAV